MKFPLYTQIALGVDIPEHGLLCGDLGTVIEFFPETAAHPAGYAIEVFDALGETVAVFSLPEDSLVALDHQMIPATRLRAAV